MDKDQLKSLAIVTAQRARAAGITQNDIAIAVNASQSQVSRILSGSSLKQTKLFDEICIYVNNAARGVSSEVVRNSDEMMEAIASVWDGTAHQAEAIAMVIRSLGHLIHGANQAGRSPVKDKNRRAS